MLYLANPTSSPAVHRAMRQRRIGFIATPLQGNKLIEGVIWCADNGCFGKGYPGDDGWIRWLKGLRHRAGDCLFATAPDVVGETYASLERSLPLLPIIRDIGFKPALVAQDGMEDIELPWDEFDCLFLGGLKKPNPADEWKMGPGAKYLALEAKRRGKWVHCGRVNSNRRYRYMAGLLSEYRDELGDENIGCDSCDGTYLRFGPDTNIPKLLGWVNEWKQQDILF